jgi:hypothetical protein
MKSSVTSISLLTFFESMQATSTHLHFFFLSSSTESLTNSLTNSLVDSMTTIGCVTAKKIKICW